MNNECGPVYPSLLTSNVLKNCRIITNWSCKQYIQRDDQQDSASMRKKKIEAAHCYRRITKLPLGTRVKVLSIKIQYSGCRQWKLFIWPVCEFHTSEQLSLITMQRAGGFHWAIWQRSICWHTTQPQVRDHYPPDWWEDCHDLTVLFPSHSWAPWPCQLSGHNLSSTVSSSMALS